MTTNYIYPKEVSLTPIHYGLDCDWQAVSFNSRIRALVLAISVILISLLHSFEGVCKSLYWKRKVLVGYSYPSVIDVTEKFNCVEIDGVKSKVTRALHNLIDNTYEVEVSQMPGFTPDAVVIGDALNLSNEK